MIDATTVRASETYLAKAEGVFGYGYQVYLFPGSRRQFALLGYLGQRILVDPPSKLVMVQTAVDEKSPKLASVVGRGRAVRVTPPSFSFCGRGEERSTGHLFYELREGVDCKLECGANSGGSRLRPRPITAEIWRVPRTLAYFFPLLRPA